MGGDPNVCPKCGKRNVGETSRDERDADALCWCPEDPTPAEAELTRLRALERVVREELVPIVEMTDPANDPSDDLYLVMHHVKELLP